MIKYSRYDRKVGRGKRWGTRQAHRAPSRTVAGMFPFVASGSVGVDGIYVGPNRHGGAPFCYDPFMLYPHVLSNPNALLIGPQGMGKSATEKTVFGAWQLQLGRKVFVVSPKPHDYDRLAEAYGVKPIYLAPGSGICLNVLTATGTSMIQRLQSLKMVAAAQLERPLTPAEKDALQRSLDKIEKMRRRTPLPWHVPTVDAHVREATIPDIVEELYHGNLPDVDHGEIRRLAQALRELISGDLAGLFDGPTTEGIDLDDDLVVLDIGALQEGTGMSVAMVAATAWLQATATGVAGGGQSVFACDEAWRMFDGGSDTIQNSVKTSRRGVANVFAIHRVSDLEAIGSEGSKARAVAKGILKDCATKVIFGSNELEETTRLLELNDTQQQWLADLGTHEALWLVGDKHSFVVEHDMRDDYTKWLIDTNQGMTKQ